MLNLNATLDGLEDALAALHAMEDASGPLRSIHADWSGAAIRTYQRHTPVGRGEQPGKLKQGYAITEQHAGPVSAMSRIENRTPYLRYVLEGRGPVVAKGRALRFVISGVVFFRKAVGPAEANPFHEAAEAEIEDMSGRYAEQLADQLAARWD